MPYTRLYVLIEGDDDKRFVERIIIPTLASRYDCVQTWPYANKKKEKVNSFLRSIKIMGADFFLLADIDACPCVQSKREILLQKFKELTDNRIIIVVKEIESWFMAGLKDDNPLRVNATGDTSNLTKEQFDNAVPEGFDSRINFMLEVLANFHVPTAAKRNASFSYFARRCGLSVRNT
jgi:hypothetical protein